MTPFGFILAAYLAAIAFVASLACGRTDVAAIFAIISVWSFLSSVVEAQEQ